jgi:hypothetical protein
VPFEGLEGVTYQKGAGIYTTVANDTGPSGFQPPQQIDSFGTMPQLIFSGNGAVLGWIDSGVLKVQVGYNFLGAPENPATFGTNVVFYRMIDTPDRTVLVYVDGDNIVWGSFYVEGVWTAPAPIDLPFDEIKTMELLLAPDLSLMCACLGYKAVDGFWTLEFARAAEDQWKASMMGQFEAVQELPNPPSFYYPLELLQDPVNNQVKITAPTIDIVPDISEVRPDYPVM